MVPHNRLGRRTSGRGGAVGALVTRPEARRVYRENMIPATAQRGRPATAGSRYYVAAALAYVLALTAVEVGLESEFHSLDLYSVAVAFAGATCTVAWTAFILAVTLAAATAITFEYETWTTRSSALVIALVLVSAVAIFGSRLRERGRSELARAKSIAEITQSAILRPIDRRIGDVQVASLYVPAERDATVGGDLFEGIETNFGARLIIGDVRGKGLPAVADAAATLAAFRVMAFETRDLDVLAGRLDRHLAMTSAQQPDDSGATRFVTALLVEFPPDRPEARLVSCGHPPPLLDPADGTVGLVEVDDPAPPLNLGALSDVRPRVLTVPFPVGHRLLLYTDGVTEARDGEGTFYPLEQRYPAGIEAVQPLLAALGSDLASYARSLRDDVAMVLVQRLPTGTD